MSFVNFTLNLLLVKYKNLLIMKKLLLSLLSLTALGANAQVVPLGSAANMLTLLNANMHCISVSDACSSLVFIHRSDPTLFPTENPAFYRYDISTDNGVTFDINKGPLNPTANNTSVSCRYPQVLIDNPTNATNPANVNMQYLGTYHNGGDWDGITTGTGKLDNSGYTESNTNINGGDVSVVTSMCKGAANTFWATSYSIDASNVNLGDIIILKGTQTGNNVTWTSTIKTPNWDQHSGSIKAGSLNIAFDPTGTNGWISFLGDIRSELDVNIDEVYDLNFYKTNDAGATWTGPYTVNLNDFALIQSIYPVPTTGTTVIHAVSAAFESDLAVDKDGQPHMFFTMGYGSSESDIAAGNGYSIRASNMFDLSYDISIDRFVLNFVARSNQLRADSIGFTTDANNATIANTEDQRPQVSTSPAGDIVFFTWADNIEQNIGGIDTVIESATARYLNLSAMVPGVARSANRVISNEAAYSAVGEKAYFFNTAPQVQRKPNASVIPVVYGILNPIDKKLESTASFAFMQNIEVLDDSIRYLIQSDTLGFEVVSPTSITNATEIKALEIYPNPATTHFCVANVTGNKNTIRITNLNGAVVYTTTFSSSILKTISTKELAAGTYIVELESDGKITKTKLTKN